MSYGHKEDYARAVSQLLSMLKHDRHIQPIYIFYDMPDLYQFLDESKASTEDRNRICNYATKTINDRGYMWLYNKD